MNYLAFDIGGTNTKYAIMNSLGEILKRNEIPTPESYDTLVELIVETYKDEPVDSRHIGLSCPGIYNPDQNQITGSSALDYLVDKDIVGDIKKHLKDVEVYIENDGNCALLGEVWKGHAQNKKNAAIIVVGSAIGGGAYVNGQLLRGEFLNAGEFGYMMIDNNVEEESFRSFGGKSGLNGFINSINNKGYSIQNGLELFQEMEKDSTLYELVQQQLLYTAIGIINIQYMIDPAVVIVGGAISRNECYLKMLHQAVEIVMQKRPHYKVKPQIVPAKNGNDANLLGIVYKCLQFSGSK